KDEAIGTAFAAADGSRYAGAYMLLGVSALVTAALTAFYTFRAYFLTFQGELMVPPEADASHHGYVYDPARADAAHGAHESAVAPLAHHPRASYESPRVMTIPLAILAVFAAGVGLAVGPTGFFEHFLERTPLLPPAPPHAIEWKMMLLGALIALGGVG